MPFPLSVKHYSWEISMRLEIMYVSDLLQRWFVDAGIWSYTVGFPPFQALALSYRWQYGASWALLSCSLFSSLCPYTTFQKLFLVERWHRIVLSLRAKGWLFVDAHDSLGERKRNRSKSVLAGAWCRRTDRFLLLSCPLFVFNTVAMVQLKSDFGTENHERETVVLKNLPR